MGWITDLLNRTFVNRRQKKLDEETLANILQEIKTNRQESKERAFEIQKRLERIETNICYVLENEMQDVCKNLDKVDPSRATKPNILKHPTSNDSETQGTISSFFKNHEPELSNIKQKDKGLTTYHSDDHNEDNETIDQRHSEMNIKREVGRHDSKQTGISNKETSGLNDSKPEINNHLNDTETSELKGNNITQQEASSKSKDVEVSASMETRYEQHEVTNTSIGLDSIRNENVEPYSSSTSDSIDTKRETNGNISQLNEWLGQKDNNLPEGTMNGNRGQLDALVGNKDFSMIKSENKVKEDNNIQQNLIVTANGDDDLYTCLKPVSRKNIQSFMKKNLNYVLTQCTYRYGTYVADPVFVEKCELLADSIKKLKELILEKENPALSYPYADRRKYTEICLERTGNMAITAIQTLNKSDYRSCLEKGRTYIFRESMSHGLSKDDGAANSEMKINAVKSLRLAYIVDIVLKKAKLQGDELYKGSDEYTQKQCQDLVPYYDRTKSKSVALTASLNKYAVWCILLELFRWYICLCSLVTIFSEEKDFKKFKQGLHKSPNVNVVLVKYFEMALRESVRIQVDLTFTHIHSVDDRIPHAVPIYVDGFIHRKDLLR